jgi:poly(3-hydroxybutyrate) depolymerase
MAPFRLMATAGQQMFSNPAFPVAHTRYGRSVAAACELFERSTRRYLKPAFGLDHTMIGREVVAVEEEEVFETGFCVLRRFRRAVRQDDPKVLLVAPLSGHFATLLRGTVAALLPDHDVYVTDWKDASQVSLAKGHFDLDDYIDDVARFLQVIGPGTHVIAVCQPSVPVLAAVSLMAADGDAAVPRSMVLMGGPVDTRVNPTKVNELAENRPIEWFERAVISSVPVPFPGAMRRVYPGFLQLSGFMTMNLDRHVGAHMQMFDHLVQGDGESAAAHRRFYDEYMSVMDLPAEYYLQTVRTVFQEHALPRGAMVSRGRAIEPGAITKTALLTVEGEFDDISGLGQTRAAQDLCTGIPADRRRHHEQAGAGHYGIFNGKRWHGEIYPIVRDFIRANS